MQNNIADPATRLARVLNRFGVQTHRLNSKQNVAPRRQRDGSRRLGFSRNSLTWVQNGLLCNGFIFVSVATRRPLGLAKRWMDDLTPMKGTRMKIYKRNQGKYTRGVTAAVVMALGLWMCWSLKNLLVANLSASTNSTYISFGAPLAVFVLLGLLVFKVLNRTKSADFLIATENEMKKVSWSSTKEVIGSTKVVVVTTFLMAGMLFLVDMLFFNIFQLIGIQG
jgi:preprotein translocase subunit SecE